jgi:hypothetical protein
MNAERVNLRAFMEAEGLTFLSVHPLSLRILLVETPGGWWLTDGRRAKFYKGFEAALADRTTRRCLEYGEPLP